MVHTGERNFSLFKSILQSVIPDHYKDILILLAQSRLGTSRWQFHEEVIIMYALRASYLLTI